MAAEADKIRAKLQSYSVASQNELCPLQDYHAHCCAYVLHVVLLRMRGRDRWCVESNQVSTLGIYIELASTGLAGHNGVHDLYL